MGKYSRLSPSADVPKGPDKSFKTLVKNAVWAYQVMFRLSKIDTLILFFSSITSAVVPILSSYIAARFIDEIIGLVSSGVSSINELQIDSPLVITLLLVVTTAFLVRLSQRINDYMGEKFEYYHFDLFNVELLTRISNLDVVQFEDPEISNDIQKARDHGYKIYQFASNSVDVFIKLIRTIIAGTIAFSVSPLLFLLIVLLSIPNNAIYAKFIKAIWHYYNNWIEQFRTYWTSVEFLTEETAMPEQKVTNSHHFISQFSTHLRAKLSGEELQMRKTRFAESIPASLINMLIYIITPLFLVSRVLAGIMTIGQFTFFQGQLFDFSYTLDKMLGRILELADSTAYLTYVRKIFEIKPAIISGEETISKDHAPTIEFRNVSFKYPRAKQFALKNISLTIDPSEEIAFVGENGAGKTTLIKLLLRFYDPTEGDIFINGKSIQSYEVEDYHDIFGTLFQDYNRYGFLSVKKNITIGDFQRTATKDKIHHAAIEADAADFIEKLDLKYDTKLAKQYTNGTNLSTGQWQKLALARMFYRDRPVLILDEPTASIDAEAEFRIFQRIYNFTENKTIIIISHRFSTVRNAKRIYVLHHGQLVEQGSHDELISQKGRYAKAFSLQAKGYQYHGEA